MNCNELAAKYGFSPEEIQAIKAELNHGDFKAAIQLKNAIISNFNAHDPEIPVNIVDLGLVYQCNVKTSEAGAGNDVNIVMTLTAPGCGMGPIIQGDVEKSVRALPGVASVAVEVVFDPPWTQDVMSEVAKVQLGLI